MHTPNKHFTRIVVWSLTGSILTNSCTNSASFLEEHDAQNMIENKKERNTCIKVKLSSEDAKYVQYLSTLADRLIKDPQFAKEMLNTPKHFLKTRANSCYETVLDAEVEGVISAFADEQVATAIKEQDIAGYLQLMHERGYLTKGQLDCCSYLTEDQRREILLSIGLTEEEEIEEFPILVGAVVSILYFTVAVISYGTIAYTAIAAVNIAALATIAYHIAAVASTKVSGNSTFDFTNDSAFDIWIVKTGEEEITLPLKDYRESIKSVLKVYKNIVGEKLTSSKEDRLEQIIDKNIIKELEKLEGYDI